MKPSFSHTCLNREKGYCQSRITPEDRQLTQTQLDRGFCSWNHENSITQLQCNWHTWCMQRKRYWKHLFCPDPFRFSTNNEPTNRKLWHYTYDYRERACWPQLFKKMMKANRLPAPTNKFYFCCQKKLLTLLVKMTLLSYWPWFNFNFYLTNQKF